MAEITFGTDGWRAIIAEDFTFDNVRCVSQAIATHLRDEGLADRGIVIGFDTRFLAEKFALVVAEVMTGYNIQVYLCKTHTPTPVVAHAVTVHNAGGAVMLTASHNPAEYLGIKFIPAYAGPALPADIAPIVACLVDIQKSGTVDRYSLTHAWEKGLVETIEPMEEYVKHVEKLIDFSAIKKSGINVVVDPMYGAGIGYLDEFLTKHGCKVETINNKRDPLFGGALPEPTAHHLKALAEKVKETKADIGVALDGDADRLGVIDPSGRYYSPNEILTLFMEYLIESRGWEGTVARTVATTHMLDRIADHHGFSIVETPVGFKYIGQAMREQDAFLGGEESGGVSIRGHVPEKDGILGCLLFIEMLAKTGKTAAQLLKEISDRYGPLYSERIDLRTTEEAKKDIINNMENWEPKELAGTPVVSQSRVDGLKIVLENGNWCLVRASGTEPVFRIYVEADSEEEKKKIQQHVKQTLCSQTKEGEPCTI
ncbi:phosphoglucomutase/phosphomannomutase family protein [Dethiobacter alkaliphilus]|uniref:phosphoglucomutase/phosphomannomutase family protein n=1 Tax=Dethiobacter alkaliphilus TaxID=427926 RepID=UPI002226D6D5|nr:phosphoglucomutase/phosphomannomutase family protein [Dethiobacter alkaliphilus]MCW3488769.1 phosphoglucomutase/phosphomannomutase family protein [Dethiobacter alkaliphilus]